MWFLEMWGVMTVVMLGFALLLAFIFLCTVAVEGKDSVESDTWIFLGLIALSGLALPLLILTPFYGIYRLIRE